MCLLCGTFGYTFQRIGDPLAPVAVLVIGITSASLALMSYSKLIIEVRPDGLCFRFAPFHRSFRRIPLDKIEHFEAVKYSPIGEFGGWGLRRGWRGGRAYNVSGNRGVRLSLSEPAGGISGRKLLLGSQRAEELAAAIESARK